VGFTGAEVFDLCRGTGVGDGDECEYLSAISLIELEELLELVLLEVEESGVVLEFAASDGGPEEVGVVRRVLFGFVAGLSPGLSEEAQAGQERKEE
jgi:hypothetical protein